MERKTLDSVLGTTEVRRDSADEMQIRDRKKGTGNGYENKEVELKKNYNAISKNGDTLELSEKRLEKPDSDMNQKKKTAEAILPPR